MIANKFEFYKSQTDGFGEEAGGALGGLAALGAPAVQEERLHPALEASSKDRLCSSTSLIFMSTEKVCQLLETSERQSCLLDSVFLSRCQ